MTILQGDALERLRGLPAESVHCCVTSPPYMGLRRYAAGAQEMGNEAAPEDHIERLVAVFREVRRVLRDDGTLWLNYSGGYSGGGRGDRPPGAGSIQAVNRGTMDVNRAQSDLADGNLLGLPERLALALQADGWVWRSTVVWAKPAPMPESVSGWRWEQHRVKIGRNGRGREAQKSAARSPQQDHDGRDFAQDAFWAPCPGCPSCAKNQMPCPSCAGQRYTSELTLLRTADDPTVLQPVEASLSACQDCAGRGTVGLVLRRCSWRPTRAWEPIFMLTKGRGYYADGEAVKESAAGRNQHDLTGPGYSAPGQAPQTGSRSGNLRRVEGGIRGHLGSSIPWEGASRNPRNVWVLPPEPCNWDFCLACGTWYGAGGWARRSIKRWSTRELDVETEEYRSVPHRCCAQCKAMDEFVDHYAAFPSELPRRCIAASTSERGVCPTCAAPWTRVVERRASTMNIRVRDAKLRGQGAVSNVHKASESEVNQYKPEESGGATKTLGWRPTCQHQGSPVPAIVLDPFLGTGTTLLAASRLGRAGIGIDLSPRYVALAEARLRADAPLLGMAQTQFKRRPKCVDFSV